MWPGSPSPMSAIIFSIFPVWGSSCCLLRDDVDGQAKCRRTIRRVAFAPAAGLVVILGMLTWLQSGIYRDAETLYRATLARNPTCWVAHYNLGDVLNGLPGRQAEVIEEWETTLRYKPDYAEAHSNLACILASIPDRVSEAIEHFKTALRYKPDLAEAHSNLAAVLSNYPDRIPEAIEQFKAALRYDPDSAETHNNYGNLLIDIPGQLTEAIAQTRNRAATPAGLCGGPLESQHRAFQNSRTIARGHHPAGDSLAPQARSGGRATIAATSAGTSAAEIVSESGPVFLKMSFTFLADQPPNFYECINADSPNEREMCPTINLSM